MSFEIPPTPPLNCEAFRARVHERDEFARADRQAFDRHAAACRPCACLLLEVERMDDLLLQWVVPDRARGGEPDGADSFEERVVKAVRGEGPAASCTEAVASLHHFVAGDLEPWIAARVERHLARCTDCRDHLDEVKHSRKVWLSWGAPDPNPGFADEIVRRLEPETRAARRRRQLLELVFGAIRVPRAAAALVLCSLTLLTVGVLRQRTGLMPERPGVTDTAEPSHGSPGMNGAPSMSAAGYRPPVVPANWSPHVGGSDPTDSLSPDLSIGPRGLKSALRGK